MPLFDDVCHMYEQIKLCTNETCKNCRPLHKNPLSMWHVGENFAEDKYKLLFVGKTGRRDWSKVIPIGPDGYIDTTKKAEEYFFDRSWPFWKYTKDLISDGRLYGSAEKGWERIALTNIVKCTDADKDNTKDFVKNNCICKLGVIQREIEILKPKNVIFYTGDKYDSYIDILANRLKSALSAKEVVSKIGVISSRKGNDLKFNTKEIIGEEGLKMRFLITSHPQGQKKERFNNNIVEWIKGKPSV